MDSLLKKNYIASKNTVLGWKYESEKEILRKYGTEELEELIIINNGKSWHTKSSIDMSLAIDIWGQQFDDKNITYASIFVIYGFGNMGYIEKLIEKYPENVVLVYEPFEEVIVKQMKNYDMTKLFENDKLYIFTGEERQKLWRKYIGSIVSYDNYHDIICVQLPNYVKIDIDEYIMFKQSIDYFICNEVESAKLMVTSEKNRGRNFLYNLYDFLSQSGIKNLKDTFAKYDLTGYSAIIVSAGPSLDRNIAELTKYKDKVFIIGLNASLNVLRSHNITPDIMLSYDPKISDISPFDDDYNNKIPLLTNLTADYRVVKRNRARRFFGYENNSYINKLAKKINVQLMDSDNGGCVANAAFAFAQTIGFKTIILVGQDLAYTNNKLHAGNRIDEKKLDLNQKKYIMVKGVYGDEVPTDRIMCTYRKWFENRINDYPELNVINATEGGAFIDGAIHMKLSDALKEYCTGENFDFRKVIDESEPAFSQEERAKAFEIISEAEREIAAEKKKLLGQKVVYEKIDLLNRKQKYHTTEFRKCLKNAGEIEKNIEDDMNMDLIKLFVNDAEVCIKNKMRKKEDNAYEEIKLAVDSGMELLDGYALACDKLKETWEEVHTLIEESKNERANEKTI